MPLTASPRSIPDLGDGFAFLRRMPDSVDGIRIGIADSWFWDSCENGIDDVVRRAIDTLARAGAVVKEAPLPEVHDVWALYMEGGLSAIELRAFLDRELPDWLATIDRGQRAGAQKCRKSVGTGLSRSSRADA